MADDYYYGDDDYRDNYWQYRGGKFIFTYIAPVVVILGTLGNLLAFIVLQNKSYRKQSTGFILSALAIVDTGMLYTGLLWQSIDLGTDVSPFSCKLHYFLLYLFSHASPMTITLMMAERVVSVWWPFKLKSLFTRVKVAMVWGGAMFVFILINSHNFVTMELKVISGISDCSIANYTGREAFHMGALYWIDAIISSFFPVILILTGNILIIAKFLLVNNECRQSSYNRSVSTVTNTKSTTTMLLTVSIVFLLCTLPRSIYEFGRIKAGWWAGLSTVMSNFLELARFYFSGAIVTLLFYLNNAIKFPLYCLVGARFRQIMFKMLCKRPIERITHSFRDTGGRPHVTENGSSTASNEHDVNSTTEVTSM